MKLKEILDEKTIDIITQNSNDRYTSLMKDCGLTPQHDKKGNPIIPKEHSVSAETDWNTLRPYFKSIFFDQLMYAIKDKDQEFHDELYNNIMKNKGETEIDLDVIEQKVPSIKGLNEIFRFYNKN